MTGYVLRSAPPIGSYFVDRREGSGSRSGRVTMGRVDRVAPFGLVGWVAWDAEGRKIEGDCDGGRWHTRAEAAEAVRARYVEARTP